MGEFLRLKNEIDNLLRMYDKVIVAIDGRCTSGKSTMGERLLREYDLNLFHMDDFFLPITRKTKERMEEIGGNVDYERVLNEIILPLKSGCDFSYRPFDCSIQSLGDEVEVCTKRLNVIEGTYSMHPLLFEHYTYRVFLDINEKKQNERVKERFNADRFFDEWIPLEEKYFNTLKIKDRADLILKA